jgi:rhodanese-related sulfurtransferase
VKIIYNCYGGSHSSVTSAAIHLGLLDCAKVPCSEALWKLPYFDTQVKKDHGTLHLLGTDEFNNQVYCVGRRNMGNVVKNAINSVAEIFLIPKQDFKLVNPMPFVNMAMVIGGFTSRRLGIVPLGRPIVTWGTKLAFPQLHQLVREVKADLSPSFPIDIKPVKKKIVIYCDYTGRNQAFIAAALHLGISKDKLVIPRVPIGTINYIGTDNNGTEVYTLGVSYENKLIPKIVRGFADLYCIPKENISIADLTKLGKYSFGLAILLRFAGLHKLADRWSKLAVKRRKSQLAAVVKDIITDYR